MKIKCNYCANYFDDTLAKCPYCAAPNEGIKRTASDQPLTIEDLKKWYESKGLPPAETTRFFIGVDYEGPRAFGIYKDKNTGEVIVYKNKDNGTRAIRYRGTDEAYGVNELFQRLKQEIIQQKMNNVKKAKAGESGSAEEKKGILGLFKGLFAGCLVIVAAVVGLLAIIIATGAIIISVTPKDGYYLYQDNYYYYDDSGYDEKYVFAYDASSGQWKEPVSKEADPGIFKKKSKCKKFFLSLVWDSSYACSNLTDETVYKDYKASRNIEPGYYAVNSTYFYHYGYNYASDWYQYSDDDDDDWSAVDSASLPDALAHPSNVGDFYYTPTWDESTQFSDFTESDEYEENYAHSSDSSDSDYSWDSSDSWDSDSTDWGSDW